MQVPRDLCAEKESLALNFAVITQPSVRLSDARHNEREQQLIVEQIFLQQSARRQLVVEYKAPPIPVEKYRVCGSVLRFASTRVAICTHM